MRYVAQHAVRDASNGRLVAKYKPIQIGERFGLWVVISKCDYKNHQQKWLCRCECGFENQIATHHLRAGHSTCCVKCAAKKISERARLKNLGKYSPSRRLPYVKAVVVSLYEGQNGVCPICGKQLPSLDKCAWDHDHLSGEGRALLHKGCNVFLGFIERDSSVLERVIQYCKRYNILINL